MKFLRIHHSFITVDQLDYYNGNLKLSLFETQLVIFSVKAIKMNVYMKSDCLLELPSE